MGAAEDNEDDANGVERGTGPSGSNTNVPLSWRPVYVRARTIINTTLKHTPFSWPPGAGPSTTSTYDQVEGDAEQSTGRYIDSVGQVWDEAKFRIVMIEWLVDGAPTPLTAAKLAGYAEKGNVLRDWPTGFPGAQPGEPQSTYPAWPPTS